MATKTKTAPVVPPPEVNWVNANFLPEGPADDLGRWVVEFIAGHSEPDGSPPKAAGPAMFRAYRAKFPGWPEETLVKRKADLLKEGLITEAWKAVRNTKAGPSKPKAVATDEKLAKAMQGDAPRLLSFLRQVGLERVAEVMSKAKKYEEVQARYAAEEAELRARRAREIEDILG